MAYSLSFRIKQAFKAILQNKVLPVVYGFWKFIYRDQAPSLIIFADSHHDALPFSMEYVHNELTQKGYPVTDIIYNYANMPLFRSLFYSIRFMRLYAQARFVFICDNFLPVSSCKKRPDTFVVQLLHFGGLFKRMGYDTAQDIPSGYPKNVYRNYDLVTVSSPVCVKTIAHAMLQPEEIFVPLGSSRTDFYFQHEWQNHCKDQFYSLHPEARGKKIILWAPTFRGNAATPTQVGLEHIRRLKEELGSEYFLIVKVHPHVDNACHLSDCSIPTEQLFPVTDLLITDYSSVAMDYMLFEKPYVLFAPDYIQFQHDRGFYVDYTSLCPYIVTDSTKLKDIVQEALSATSHEWIRIQKAFHMQNCDGHSTERILEYIGL